MIRIAVLALAAIVVFATKADSDVIIGGGMIGTGTTTPLSPVVLLVDTGVAFLVDTGIKLRVQ